MIEFYFLILKAANLWAKTFWGLVTERADIVIGFAVKVPDILLAAHGAAVDFLSFHGRFFRYKPIDERL